MTQLGNLSVMTYVQLRGLCLALFLAMFVSTVKRNRQEQKRTSNWVLGCYVSYSVLVIADAAWALLPGSGRASADAMYLVNSVYFFAEALGAMFWFLYSERVLESRWTRKLPLLLIAALPAMASCYFVITSRVSGKVFYIDGDLNYVRGPWYLSFLCINYLYCAVTGVHALIRGFLVKTVFEKKRCFVLAAYVVLLGLFGAGQIFFGYGFTCLGLTVGLLAVFVYNDMSRSVQTGAIESGLSGFFDAVFAVDVDADTVRTLRVSESYVGSMRRLAGETRYSVRIEDGILHNIPEENQAKIRELFDAKKVMRRLEKKNECTSTYRVRRKDGSLVYHRVDFVRINESDGRRQFLLGISDVQEEVRDQKDREHQMAVVSSLTSDYDCVYYLTLTDDLNMDKCHCYRESEAFVRDVPGWDKPMGVHDRLQLMEDRLVYPEDREQFRRNTRRYVLQEHLEKEKSYYVNFRIVVAERIYYYQMKFVADITEEGEMIGMTMGIHSVDRKTRREIQEQEMMEMTISERTAELRAKNRSLNQLNENIVELLGNLTEARDVESGEHIRRVKGFTHILAEQVMKDYPEYGLTMDKVDLISAASALHDVGKIAIPDAVLLKPGKLTPEEFDLMKTHCQKGCEILKKAPKQWSETYLKTSMEICHFHHERYDGKGYPEGLRGDEIPISAQIVAVADCYDALTQKRVYKDACVPAEAHRMIRDGECGSFSPRILAAFDSCQESFEKLLRNPFILSSEPENSRLSAESLEGTRILLVEDNEINRDITREMLEEEGALVTVAVNGKEAVMIFRNAIPGSFDAVLMDIIMPQMNGLDATRMIRRLEIPYADTVPIIALTGGSSTFDTEMCVDAGMDAFLTKPVNISSLTRVMLDCMRNQSENLQKKLDSAMKLANRDPLTGVKNMTAYTAAVEQLSKELKADPDIRFAIVECDINGLKQVNDTYGHNYGDLYIRNCSKIICDVFKRSPVYRIGGDEFAVILRGDDFSRRETLLEDLKVRVMESSKKVDVDHGRVSFAGGIGIYVPGEDQNVSSVFKKADISMYNNKRRMEEGGR